MSPLEGCRVTVTGASGLIGRRLAAAMLQRGAEVTALSRDPRRARKRLAGVEAIAWDPLAGPAPAAALAGRDAVVHLAGEPVAQRWSEGAKRAIRDSRVVGTRNLVAGLGASEPRPHTLISSSAIGYYGPHGEEPLDEDAPPGGDFLADVCVEWEREAGRAAAVAPRRRSAGSGTSARRRTRARRRRRPLRRARRRCPRGRGRAGRRRSARSGTWAGSAA